ncbi:cytochrome P450 [Paraherbaspirillum soli]|uniref:Cytochrome P450 n=1 Tax=Paraherbaspirillum soli TaxID=631222 RepID=A0ABW0MA60_9BURK
MPIQVRQTIVDKRALVCDPAGIRHVFLDNAKNYPKNELQLRMLRPALGAGVLTSNGEDWRRQRRILAPLFSPQQIQVFTAAKARVAAHAVERLRQTQDGSFVDMSLEMGRLTLEMLEHTLFSQGLGRDASEFQHAITRYFDTLGQLDAFDMLGLPDFLPRLNRLRGRATLKFSARVVNDIIANRRHLLASGADAPPDILTLLLKAQDPDTGRFISEQELRDNIVTFIGAGHETTANALTWTLYILSQAPDWRARVEAEIDACFDPAAPTAHLPVTKAVVEETMRLYPPVSMMSRVALHDDMVAGTAIRAGTIVTVAPYVLHRHQTLWNDPDVFDPERFLGANRSDIDRYAYLPFGVGSRVCIGMGFAMSEMLVILGHFLREFRFDLAPGHPVAPEVRLTMRPAHGMKMRVRKRQA